MTLDLTCEEWEKVFACPLFQAVPQQWVRDRLDGPGCTRAEYRAGETIYHPHEFSRSLGILLSGQVEVKKGAFPVSRLRPGELFGAAALYNEEPDYVTTLVAGRDCTVLLLTQKRVSQLLADCPDVGHNYIRYLSGRIRFLSGKLEELTGPTAEAKLLCYLRAHSHTGRVETDCSMTELAKRLGMGRATLYRALDTLEETHQIERDGKAVMLKG